MGHHIIIAEPALDNHSWWISFPALPGVTAAANAPGAISKRAREALASAVEAGAKLPPTIEEAGVTPFDLDDVRKPLVLLISLDQSINKAGDAEPRSD
jgi:predicted RNase H-like HicB family nuclease